MLRCTACNESREHSSPNHEGAEMQSHYACCMQLCDLLDAISECEALRAMQSISQFELYSSLSGESDVTLSFQYRRNIVDSYFLSSLLKIASICSTKLYQSTNHSEMIHSASKLDFSKEILG